MVVKPQNFKKYFLPKKIFFHSLQLFCQQLISFKFLKTETETVKKSFKFPNVQFWFQINSSKTKKLLIFESKLDFYKKCLNLTSLMTYLSLIAYFNFRVRFFHFGLI